MLKTSFTNPTISYHTFQKCWYRLIRMGVHTILLWRCYNVIPLQIQWNKASVFSYMLETQTESIWEHTTQNNKKIFNQSTSINSNIVTSYKSFTFDVVLLELNHSVICDVIYIIYFRRCVARAKSFCDLWRHINHLLSTLCC